MKRIIIVVCSVIFFVGVVNAQQNGTVVKRSVEKSRKANTKATYNYMLLDAIKESDDASTKLEALVQDVWNKKSNEDIAKASKIVLGEIDSNIDWVTKTPIYIGGNDYQAAVLDYLEAVKVKVEALTKYGILGANEVVDADEYNNAADAYNNAWDEASLKRDVLKEKKTVYEKTFHIEK